MSTQGDRDEVSVTAGADLSTFQYKIVTVSGTLAAANATALGVLQNKPKSGESARVAYSGHMKAIVGAAVTAGDELSVTTSGYLITNATSVGGIVGKAMKTAGSGALCEFVGDFSVARTAYSTGTV
jgi:hypothetical protein